VNAAKVKDREKRAQVEHLKIDAYVASIVDIFAFVDPPGGAR
jgi:hypothetical protein